MDEYEMQIGHVTPQVGDSVEPIHDGEMLPMSGNWSVKATQPFGRDKFITMVREGDQALAQASIDSLGAVRWQGVRLWFRSPVPPPGSNPALHHFKVAKDSPHTMRSTCACGFRSVQFATWAMAYEAGAEHALGELRKAVHPDW